MRYPPDSKLSNGWRYLLLEQRAMIINIPFSYAGPCHLAGKLDEAFHQE